MLLAPYDKRPAGCISDLGFDEWEAGEHGSAELRELESHVASCSRCAERQRGLRAHAANVLAHLGRLPASKAVGVAPKPEVRRSWQRLHAAARSQRGVVWLATGLAAAAALMLWRGGPSESTVRLKGRGARVGFFVRQGERVYRGADGEHVRPGDQLRFAVRTERVVGPERVVHLVIAGLDARGVASIYYATTDSGLHVSTRDDEVLLDSAVELDATLGRERIFAVMCDAQPDPRLALRGGRQLLRELEATGQVARRPGCDVQVMSIVKEEAEH